MPFPIITVGAQIMCMHGGQVQIIPKPGATQIGGVFPICLGDLIGAPVVGCPVPPPIAGPGPCLTVAADPGLGWASASTKSGGKPVLVNKGMPSGLTAGGSPAPLQCLNPGQTKVMA